MTTISATAIPQDGLPLPKRRWAALAIWIAMAVSILDGSIANMALPTIAREMHQHAAAAIWVVNAYQIAIMMVLLTAAATGEFAGYRRVYLVGLAGFAFGSLLCVLAVDLTTLSLARFVQGLGAACIMGVNGALIRFTYPRAYLGRGIGYNTMIVATASAAGPSVATAVLAIASWRWLFAINLPLCLAAILIGRRCLPEGDLSGTPVDRRSGLLSAGMFAGLFLGASSLAHASPAWLTIGQFIIGAVCGWLLVRRSRHQDRPLIPLDLLSVPILRLSYAASACSFAAFMMLGVALPFFLQGVLHFDLLTTGLAITPLPLGVALSAPLAGRLVEHVPAGALGGAGLAIVAVALFFLADAHLGTSAWMIALGTGLGGVGYGMFQTPNNRTMLGVAPAGRSGSAGGMQATARLVGQIGGAVLVSWIFRAVGATTAVPLAAAGCLVVAGGAFSVLRLRR